MYLCLSVCLSIQDAVPHTKMVPFQAQIRYTRKDGMKCMRVVTVSQRATDSQEECERESDVAVVALESIQHAAREAQLGHFMEARKRLYSVERLLKRAAHTDPQMEEHVRKWPPSLHIYLIYFFKQHICKLWFCCHTHTHTHTHNIAINCFFFFLLFSVLFFTFVRPTMWRSATSWILSSGSV